MSIRDVFLAILVAFLWGSNYVGLKFNLEEIPAFLSVSMRFLLTAIILIPFIPKPKISFKELYKVSITYGIFYVAFVYYGVGLGVNPGLAVIIAQLVAPFSVIVARLVLKEKLDLASILGICLSFVGVIIAVSNTTHFNGNYFALAIVILAALGNAVFNIQSKELKDVPALSLYCWANLIAVPHSLLISYFLEGNPFLLLEKATSVFWISSFYVVASSVFFLTLWIHLLQKYPIHEVMPYNLLVPIFGVSLSVWLLHENLTWHLVVGGLVTAIGVYISHIKRKVVLVDDAEVV